jgi:hypothetical protein
MATTTKAVLASELVVARARVSQLEAQLIAERALHVRAMAAIAPITHGMPTVDRRKPAMPQWQIDRAACMAVAKAQALSSKQTVKV